SPAVLYGANSASWSEKSVSGTMWFATLPIVGPPHAWISATLSSTKFIARRTWMSSNGGWVRFIVTYQVRSPEFWWKYFFRSAFVAYLRSTCGGITEFAMSRSSAWILLWMSSALELTRNWNSSGKFSRAAFVSVFAS